MAAIIRLKRRMYTQWDETDNLKRMKDSDILAEKQRQTTDYGAIARGAAAGTVAAGTAGAVFGAGKGVFNPGSVGAASRVSGLGKGISTLERFPPNDQTSTLFEDLARNL